MKSASQLPFISHFDINSLIQTESNEIQGLLNRIGGYWLKINRNKILRKGWLCQGTAHHMQKIYISYVWMEEELE